MSETEPGPAVKTGAELARARHRLGVSIDEVAAVLRIRAAYLHALEEGRIADLPGTAYALAFLRNYAHAIGLDPDAMAVRFKAEATVLARKTDLEFPTPPPDRGLPGGAAALIAVVLAIGAYAGWYHLSGERRPAVETVAPVPAQLAPLAERAPLPVSVAAGPVTPSVPTAVTTPSPQADGTPTMAYAAEPPAKAASPSSATPRSASAATPDPAASSADAAGAHLAVRASADSWVQVRERSGTALGPVVFSGVLHAGETWPVPAQADLVMTTGNAGGTLLVVDGVAGAPLGSPGAVRRDVPLDPAGNAAPGVAAAR